jgi:hypothetical protein
MVAAIQTFGSQTRWNPHCHCLVADGLFLGGGDFLPLPPYDEEFERLLTETFRRLVLDALVREERLTEGFREKLLTFRHGGGFSVYGRHLILNEEPARLAHMARYTVRAPVAMDRIHTTDDGRVLLDIPPDPRTGDTVLALDPLEWVRRITNQIPDPKMHMTRLYGAYSNRARRLYRAGEDGAKVRILETERLPKSRASWARLIRMVFEVDPLVCVRCGAQMKILSVITSPAVIDKILRHLRATGQEALFESRAPPAA